MVLDDYERFEDIEEKKYTYEYILQEHGGLIAALRGRVPSSNEIERISYFRKLEDSLVKRVRKHQFEKEEAEKIFELVEFDAERLIDYLLTSEKRADEHFDDFECLYLNPSGISIFAGYTPEMVLDYYTPEEEVEA